MPQNKVGRREAILMFGAAGAALTLGCGGESPTSPTTTSGGSTTGGTTNAACAVTPSETAGPFPSLTDLIRSDIREGKSGTTLSLTITVVSSANNCSPVENVNVEIWQCDATGNYSQYGSQTAQTYLRGIQTTNSTGEVPPGRFANVMLWNRYYQTYDYANRRISLNRRQTKLEPDGSFKMIVAHKDPGAPNWLDAEGRPRGFIFWRFLLPEGDIAPVETKVVKVTEAAQA